MERVEHARSVCPHETSSKFELQNNANKLPHIKYIPLFTYKHTETVSVMAIA